MSVADIVHFQETLRVFVIICASELLKCIILVLCGMTQGKDKHQFMSQQYMSGHDDDTGILCHFLIGHVHSI